MQILIFLFGLSCATINAWNEWNYTVRWSSISESDADIKKNAWEAIWNKEGSIYSGKNQPPRPRRGHSLHTVTIKDVGAVVQSTLNIKNGETYIVLFGGRDNNQVKTHIPKTYDVVSVDGTISFSTYDEKPVSACNDPDNLYWSKDEQQGCGFFNSTSQVNVALNYNDVWAYRLCSGVPPNNHTAAERPFDEPCIENGWELWHAGAPQGGCTIQLGIEVCTAPSERYNHASAMFDDGALYVYGGMSERCADFCDDIWFFDIYLRSWYQIYGTAAGATYGKLTQFYTDEHFPDGLFAALDPTKVPVDNTTKAARFAGPSKRWWHSMSVGEASYHPDLDWDITGVAPGVWTQPVALYGGHRLWHGYSPENSQDNNWDSYLTRPKGGYLDDLWVYTRYLDTTGVTLKGATFMKHLGTWELKQPVEQCYPSPGLSWESRNDETCKTVKPVGRAGHGAAFDTPRNRVWIFGGYNTYYPYLSTDGQGSGPGVTSVGTGGFVPYPGYEYFRNDMWYFDLGTNIWTEVEVPADSPVPAARNDPIFLLLGDIIFMHGGFADNFIFGDTWYFNISTSRWLQKKTFVKPIYAKNCTDDFEYIRENNCTALMWPKSLARDRIHPFDILPYSEQRYYWPDDTYGPYYGINPKDWDVSDEVKQHTLDEKHVAPEGTPEFPFAATGLMQYAKNFSYEFNATHKATLIASCTSVFGEPTRGRLNDGLNGRANGSVLIAQPRPQKPGWDGCRDRADDRLDLPEGLMYVQPLPRYSHRAVWVNETQEIFFYGGQAYVEEQSKVLNDSYAFSTKSDFWYYNLNHCVNNCSMHGDCAYGFCHCYSGYYGVDCSNTSCPGTFCYYDDISQEQICRHGCQAGYTHTDADIYVQDIAKMPCSLENLGEVNGICDGFGSTQCAPPFLGDDCGTKDCKSNCSFNGWCSIEYPVSRCMCVPGYFGEICEQKLCLNNCSYPHGTCNTTSGNCNCNMMYSPYNNTREFKPWGGEDCSYIFPYAGSSRQFASHFTAIWFWVLLFMLTIVLSVGSVMTVEDNVDIAQVNVKQIASEQDYSTCSTG